MMYSEHGIGAVAFIPFVMWWALVALPFAIGFYFVAGRLGRSPMLWAVLSLIPLINVFFFIYAGFSTVLYALDRLNQLAPPHRRDTPGPAA